MAAAFKFGQHYGLQKDEVNIMRQNDGVGEVLPLSKKLEEIMSHQ
jgi:hypothetical protein